MCLLACDLAPRGEVIPSQSRGSLQGTRSCTCFIGLDPADDRAESADLDCIAPFGNFTVFVPMPPRPNVAFGLLNNSGLTTSIDLEGSQPRGLLGGTFNAVRELGSALPAHSAPSGGKWVNYPIHARLGFPKQRLCDIVATLEGRSCQDPLYGFDLEEGALTLDGQCEAFYSRAESQWP